VSFLPPSTFLANIQFSNGIYDFNVRQDLFAFDGASHGSDLRKAGSQ
jgi:hypothetical protein